MPEPLWKSLVAKARRAVGGSSEEEGAARVRASLPSETVELDDVEPMPPTAPEKAQTVVIDPMKQRLYRVFHGGDWSKRTGEAIGDRIRAVLPEDVRMAAKEKLEAANRHWKEQGHSGRLGQQTMEGGGVIFMKPAIQAEKVAQAISRLFPEQRQYEIDKRAAALGDEAENASRQADYEQAQRDFEEAHRNWDTSRKSR